MARPLKLEYADAREFQMCMRGSRRLGAVCANH